MDFHSEFSDSGCSSSVSKLRLTLLILIARDLGGLEVIMLASSGRSDPVTTMTLCDAFELLFSDLLGLLTSIVRSIGVDLDKLRSDFELLIFLSFLSSVGDNSRLEDLVGDSISLRTLL